MMFFSDRVKFYSARIAPEAQTNEKIGTCRGRYGKENGRCLAFIGNLG